MCLIIDIGVHAHVLSTLYVEALCLLCTVYHKQNLHVLVLHYQKLSKVLKLIYITNAEASSMLNIFLSLNNYSGGIMMPLTGGGPMEAL